MSLSPRRSASTLSLPLIPWVRLSWLRALLAFPAPMVLLALTVVPTTLSAQWASRYPKVTGYGHHVYLEGYEMPTLAAGPMDATAAPDGTRLAFSARGWIWEFDIGTGTATRLTMGPEMDSRPAWSPDGSMIAFVRDNDHDTRIVVVDVRSGEETHVIDSPAIELDPVFSPDGGWIVYSSGEAGTLDLWLYRLDTGEQTALTAQAGIELRPQTHPAGDRLVYLAKGGGLDRVLVRSVGADDPVELMSGAIASMARPALGPDGRSIALNWPTQSGWELRLLDIESPGRSVLLVENRLVLTPAWSADGEWIYFSQADRDEVMRLHRVRAVGGPVEDVHVRNWNWGEPTATVRIRTNMLGDSIPAPARLSVLDARGHPVVPSVGKPHFDGQSGRVFFYSPGMIEVTVPAGQVAVSAVQGLATPEVTVTADAAAGQVTEVSLGLEPVWDARSAGWTSADHHFHLNYGGPYGLDPDDLIPMMNGENLNVATPLIANLHDRFDSQELWGWQSGSGAPLIRFGQEIRSHFLGHMGLIETRDLYWPWVWGPGYQIYGRDDRTNGEVLDFAHDRGGLGYYVHPVTSPEPFDTDEGRASVPVSLVVDAVLGDVDALEIVCLWSNPIGTSAVWHRLLNIGIPIAPSAGTDVMTNFYRTMAVGTTRVYAHTGAEVTWPAYLDAYKAGRSFVTNGPLLDFRVGEAGPGEVISEEVREAGPVEWRLELRSAVPVEQVEVLVNGEIAWSGPGLGEAGQRSYSGQLDLPQGGWVAVRAMGGATDWPSMDMYPFAHTGPAWIGEIGSSDPDVRERSTTELLQVLNVSEQRLIAGYGDTEIPRLRARFREAQSRLTTLRREGR